MFGLGLPLPAAIVSMHMEGIDNMMHRSADAVISLAVSAILYLESQIIAHYTGY